VAEADPFTTRSATIDGVCRYSLSRQWDDHLPMAAWLLCNPSTADAQLDDQTCRRMVHFSRQAGCGGFNAVNVWPLRTPYPDELWKRLKRREYTAEMLDMNIFSIALAAARSEIHIVAFGPEPAKRYRTRVIDMLGLFCSDGARNLYCLGTNEKGWPLHPLARGRYAITNDRRLVPWCLPAEIDGGRP
jgi:hypothetical protein